MCWSNRWKNLYSDDDHLSIEGAELISNLVLKEIKNLLKEQLIYQLDVNPVRFKIILEILFNDIKEIIIIGAGPAGLTAAWEAEKHGVKTLILKETALLEE